MGEGQVTVTVNSGKLRFGPDSGSTDLIHSDESKKFPENGFSSEKLDSGGSVTIHVDSENTTADSVTVDVDASGSAVAVNTTATVGVDCP